MSEELSFTESRKSHHIDLAFQSQVQDVDGRFLYEPLLSAHPDAPLKPFAFLNKTMRAPIWISSMTGGTAKANLINHNLAKACNEFGLGMGLGSCRIILNDDTYLKDFDLRDTIGEAQPFYANLGIAQLEELIQYQQLYKVDELIKKLRADGLIIHVNPMQEWLQPEGDRFKYSPLETIKRVIDHADYPIIVKEVGQGMGYHSLKELFQLPIQAIDFGAHGGTNFAMLELLRSTPEYKDLYLPLAHIGHNAEEMVLFSNAILNELSSGALCSQVIISGGVKNFLDGYYFTQKINAPAVYGQASAMLTYAQHDYEGLHNYIELQVKGLELAHAYLKIK